MGNQIIRKYDADIFYGLSFCFSNNNFIGINGVNVKKLIVKKSKKVSNFLDDQMLSFIKKNRRLI